MTAKKYSPPAKGPRKGIPSNPVQKPGSASNPHPGTPPRTVHPPPVAKKPAPPVKPPAHNPLAGGWTDLHGVYHPGHPPAGQGGHQPQSPAPGAAGWTDVHGIHHHGPPPPGAVLAPRPKPSTPHPPAAPPAHPPGTPLSNTQQNAFDLMNATLKSWGLTTLAGDLRNLIVKGDTQADTLSLALSQTDAYKKRFAANDVRTANGLSELNPAQYLAAEEQYHNVLQSWGLPQGFYDKPADFTDFIGKDISPTELDSRAKIAHDQYVAAPEQIKGLWSQYYGTKGDAIAAILDPKIATQVINDRSLQVGIGGAAAMNGLQVNQARAQQLQQAGATIAGAQKAYQQIGQYGSADQAMAQRFGTTFGQTQEENDLLLNQGDAANARATLYREEQGLFKSHSAADSNSIGVSQSGY